jgi:ribosomal protein S12 methylthiotransferase
VVLPQEISYYIISLGCAKNLVDSERIHGIMHGAGFSESESSSGADILIINTCGFIEDAKRESIDVILDAVESVVDGRKNGNDDTSANFTRRVVVAGCLVARYIREIREEIPEIDFLYGILDENFVPSFCKEFGIDFHGDTDTPRKPLVPGLPYSYIKISDGCSNNCSYCAIPRIRGPVRSFPFEKIIQDVHEAVDAGACEMIIIAQDIMAYSWEDATLTSLVQAVSEVPGVKWIRLMYCHPDRLTEEVLDLMQHNEKVVRYLDLPFQHVNSRILQAMNRKGSYGIYMDLVKKIRSRIPGIHIRSTFMVGFPGETEDDFRELMSFVREAKLERVGCFMYSPEEDTRAALLDGMVPLRVKTKRHDKLMAVQKEISVDVMNGMIGRTLNVIVEEQVDECTWICRTEFDAPEVDGIFYLTAENISVNKIVNAHVTDAVEYDLIGVLA